MNDHRRSVAKSIRSRLLNALEDAYSIKDAEQEAYDNLPESLQESKNGQAMKDAVDALENAISCIEDGCDYLREIFEPYVGEE